MNMASSSTNPDSSSQTPAQRLQAQHAAAQAHQPTVEDVLDEEDVAHPPLSTLSPSANSAKPSTNGESSSAPQPVQEEASSALPKESTTASKQPMKKPTAASKPLNMESEKDFPSLGPAKPAPGASSSMSWAPKPSAAPYANGSGTYSSNVSSRASTPGPTAPGAPLNMPFPGNRANQISLPGKHNQSISLNTSQLKPHHELKKPMRDLLRELDRKSKANIDMKSANGKVHFHAKGPSPESVEQILKEAVAQLGAKQSVKIPVPASVRPHIIGRQGATVQAISKRTGARVHIPKPAATPPELEDDDVMIDIEVEGDAVTAELARREIETIVRQRTSQVNSKLRHIPAEFFPFIAGPHNSRVGTLEDGRDVRVNVPQYHQWQLAPPQPPPGNEPVLFNPQAGYVIQISGDREAAQEVQAAIDRQVSELTRILTVSQVDIERSRHKFILGAQGNSLHDFLEETGCSVIMPPPSNDTESLTIVGPPDQIENAVNKVMDLALSMQMQSVDISRQHPQAPRGATAHAQDVARYLQQRNALRDFERQYDANIVLPTSDDAASAWQIYSRDGRKAMKARAEILSLVNAHPPSRFRNLDIHPYHQQRLQQHARAVRDEYGVHVVFAEPEVEDIPLLLVYEGSHPTNAYQFPRVKPSSAELQSFEQALADAESYLLGHAGPQEEVVQGSLEVPTKYRHKLERYTAQQERQPSNAVQYLSSAQPIPTDTAGPNFLVHFRGPPAVVEQAEKDLSNFVQEQISEEAERGYITRCDFPQRFANLLIGRKGEQINKLKDQFDVEIKVQDGAVEIQGPKAKAERAKKHILDFAREQEDITTHVLKIKPHFHGDLIGAKGSQVIRLQDRYGVRIHFPRSTIPSPDSQSIADDASDNGHTTKPRIPSQALDEVVIRGPRKGADQARDELFGLYQYLQDNSHSATVSVAKSQIPRLIGARGRELNEVRASTGAQIDVPKDGDAAGRINVTIKGSKTDVETARKLIEAKVKEFDDTINQSIKVDPKHFQALIGRGGENIRQLVVQAGGSGEPSDRARLIRIPDPNAQENPDLIQLEGKKSIVENLVNAINAFVQDRDLRSTTTVPVPSGRHGLLIGKGGETRRNMESRFGVRISIPHTSVTGPERESVQVSGLPADVEKAQEHIFGLVKENDTETISVPRSLHHMVADSGEVNLFRSLNRDHQVSVAHGGQAPPPRSEGQTSQANGSAAGGGLPLITDAEIDRSTLDAEQQHSWDVSEALTGNGEDADSVIPWVLRGPSAESVAQAKARVLEAMAKAKESCVGLLTLPDPKMNRLVIGQGGSTVREIRKQSGCKIDVPKSGTENSTIEIRGKREDVERAKEMILSAVVNGTGRR